MVEVGQQELEAVVLLAEQVLYWHPNVLKCYVRRRISAVKLEGLSTITHTAGSATK